MTKRAEIQQKKVMSVEQLLSEYERLCKAEKTLTERLHNSDARVNQLDRLYKETYAKLRKYESMAGISVQASLHVNMRQLEYAFAGAKEVIVQLQAARDASLLLVDAALKGADPTKIQEAARRLAATGSTAGIAVPKALPKGQDR